MLGLYWILRLYLTASDNKKKLVVDFLEVSYIRSAVSLMQISLVWWVSVYQLLVSSHNIEWFFIWSSYAPTLPSAEICVIFRAQGECEEFYYYFKMTKSRSKAHCFKAFRENKFFQLMWIDKSPESLRIISETFFLLCWPSAINLEQSLKSVFNI